MITNLAKLMIKFVAQLLLLTLVLSVFIIFSVDSLNQKRLVIDTVRAKPDLKKFKANYLTNSSNYKNINLITSQELITNKKIELQGTVDSDITKVIVFLADDSNIYYGEVKQGIYKVELTFIKPGIKTINIVGLNNRNNIINHLIKKVKINSKEKYLIKDVPYFYQYNNHCFPDSTCQNTSIAMLLKYYGWPGNPDQITKKFGRRKAQNAKGFSKVFNYYALNYNLDVRIKNDVNVDSVYIKKLLKEGKPVVVHGKFTSSGHIIVLVGFDQDYYYANDPAGKWNQEYNGNYKQRTSTNGKYIKYKKEKLLKAMQREYGLWIHEIYKVNIEPNSV